MPIFSHQHRHDASDGVLSLAEVLFQRGRHDVENHARGVERAERANRQSVRVDDVRRGRARDEQTPSQRPAQRVRELRVQRGASQTPPQVVYRGERVWEIDDDVEKFRRPNRAEVFVRGVLQTRAPFLRGVVREV